MPTWLILLIAALNGLVYLFLVPPWQHYDEPGHFEYVWMFSRLERIPIPEDVDHAFRRELAASMVEHNFFGGMRWIPNLIDLEESPWIGISQTDDQPLYYFLVSLPLRLFSHADVTFQLYLARLVSWGLFLFTVWVGRKASMEWFGEKHALATLVPTFMAVLPGFVDLMTAVNNDVGAIAFFTLYIWIAGSLILGKISFLRFVTLIFAAVACYFTKSTAWLAILITPIVLILAIPLRKDLEWVRMAVLGILAVCFIYLVFDWQTRLPIYYYSDSSRGLRSEANPAPVGRKTFVLEPRNSLRHIIPESRLKNVRGKVVTVGAWMWANEESKATFFELIVDGKALGAKKEIDLDVQPQFYQRYYLIPLEAKQGWIVLSSNLSEGNQIYMDGISLAEGLFIRLELPQYQDSQARQGTWQGESFENLIRNGSAEKTLPQLAEWTAPIFARGNINAQYFWSLIDLDGVGWFYQKSLEAIFRTFWGQFGWAHVPLVGKRTYDVLLGFTAVAFSGIVLKIFRLNRAKWKIVLLIILTVVLQIWIVLLRGAGSWESRPLYPVARYFFPSFLPLIVSLAAGWDHFLEVLRSKRRLLMRKEWVSLALLLILNSLAWFSIVQFYYGGIER